MVRITSIPNSCPKLETPYREYGLALLTVTMRLSIGVRMPGGEASSSRVGRMVHGNGQDAFLEPALFL